MNSLDSLIREHIYNLSSGDINITKIYLVLFFLLWFVGAYLFYLGFREKDWIIIFMGITILINFPISMVYQWEKINFNVNDVDIKQEYNITLEEKDKTIELLYNENKESSKYIKKEYIKDKFKIVFSKDKEEHYFVYFDDKVKDKKSISIEEIQQFFKNNVDYSYYESLEKFRLKDLTQKDNKSSKEVDIEELEKKLNESKNNTEQLEKELNELKKK
jgi:hypothetical protein